VNRKALSLAEIAGFYGLVFAAIWLGQESRVRPPLLLAGLAILLVCRLSNQWHRDSRKSLGLDRRQLRPCFRLTLRIFALPLAVLAAAALCQPLPPLPKILFGLLGYPLWAFAQEYALLSFMSNRLKDVLGSRVWGIAALNGFLFALVHLPNPILMGFCFVGGTLFTWVFLKSPHLLPVTLVHAAAGFLLSVIFQDMAAIQMIGPAYIRWAGLPPPAP
jgi:membrane protease YdiL (CAAX protease family)